MQEYLRELAEKKINLKNLIEKVYPIEKVGQVYEELQKTDRPLITLLEYCQDLPENLQALYKEESKVYISPDVKKAKEIIM